MIFKEYDGTWLDRGDLWLSRLRENWWLAGLLLVGLNLALAWLSAKFAYDIPLLEKPIPALVVIELLAGALYLLAVWGLRNLSDNKTLLVWVFVVGALLRVGMLTSTPILEDDFYRYLWDGALVAHGINPYTYAPSAVGNDKSEENIPYLVKVLAKESSPILERVNHPDLRTIYPPVAQAAFALAHIIDPWDMTAWRGVLLIFDVATLVLLVMLLRELDLPLIWVVIYWWNPLFIKEILNSGHMDVIVFPFMLGAILFTINNSPFRAVGSLALAMGVKIWPVVFLPFLLRPLFKDKKQLAYVVFFFILVSAVLFFPVFTSVFNESSGFVAYGQRWEMNDALFMLLLWISDFLWGTVNGALAARMFVVGVVVWWIVRLVRKNSADPADLCRRCLIIVSMVFLLSPTQFPWYYVWMLPFLVIQPRLSLLLLTAMLPLYYLRFLFDAHDCVEYFDYGIVWLEYLPVWYLLLKEWRIRRNDSLSLLLQRHFPVHPKDLKP